MKLQSLPCYCATLRQAARAVTALYEEALADSGVRATQYTILQVLKLAPGSTTTEMADALGMDQTTATRMLALVKKSGLALDTPGADRRERHWALTAAGETMFRKLKPLWEAAQAEFEKRMGRHDAAALKATSYLIASKFGSNPPPRERTRREENRHAKRKRHEA
jgi:DNA-binding MarR family transcriptional regulator